jgi:hypothetical protein
MRIATRLVISIGAVWVAGGAAANVRLAFPRDVEPDFYTSVPVDALHDDEWAVIPFWRSPDAIPPDFDLLDYFDESAAQSPLAVSGFAVFDDVGPIVSEARGEGAVPVWFVRWPELREAISDGDLRIGELASLSSLRRGLASVYEDQNHIFGIHPVSHFAFVARGRLDDGTAFDVRVVEVDLDLVRFDVRFG